MQWDMFFWKGACYQASSQACRALNLAKKEGQVGTRYGLRRVFEQERRPFMLAIKAAASSGGRLR